MGQPIIAAIALIAAGAIMIYRNWQAIAAWFAALWASVVGAFIRCADAVTEAVTPRSGPLTLSPNRAGTPTSIVILRPFGLDLRLGCIEVSHEVFGGRPLRFRGLPVKLARHEQDHGAPVVSV